MKNLHPVARLLLAAIVLWPDLLSAAQSTLTPVGSPEPGWPQFRGRFRSGMANENNLLPSWPDQGPPLIWKRTGIGRGFSSPIISRAQIVVTGDTGDSLKLTAFDLGGNQLWTSTNGMAWRGQYPGARSTPTLSESRLFLMNAHGRLSCSESSTGREIWFKDVLQEFKGENITWGLSECLVVDETSVYVTAGGRTALVVALDKRNGETRWVSPGITSSKDPSRFENASYASSILVESDSRRLLVGNSLNHFYGIDASNGRLQWFEPRPTTYSVQALPVALVHDRIFTTAPHGKGGHLFKVIPPNPQTDKFKVSPEWQTRLDTCQGGVVFDGHRIYGSFYSSRKGWAALSPADGSVLYDLPDFAKGAPLLADGMIYALCEDGWMLLLKPTETRFEIKGKFRFAEASDREAWAHPVVLDGHLYLRYHDSISCFDIRRH